MTKRFLNHLDIHTSFAHSCGECMPQNMAAEIFHELTHSTGHVSRLNRLEKTAFFGSETYSKEELIAEIGAAALVNHCGLETSNSFRNSAAYIQGWLKALQNDKRFIVSASGKAEKAVDLILNK